MDYAATIGLEVHAELSTRTKMFCGCLNDSEEIRPNVNICSVCMAHPGALPVINADAVKKVLRVGAALGGRLALDTQFDRKNYFYPDIPKGYQISQYEHPLVAGGTLAGVAVTRVHLEEDTARSQHAASGSLVDFNRAGAPLMELVTEPVLHDAQTAGAFARELQLLLRSLGVSHAHMEQGQMRVEANISISARADTFGTKVEVKNLNSFRSVERAILFEIGRQREVLEQGGVVAQETRGWDERREETFSQRAKESAHDYRYFPEPDLPSLRLSELEGFSEKEIARDLPELPSARRARYAAMGLTEAAAVSLTSNTLLGIFFDAAASHLQKDGLALAANYTNTDIAGLIQQGIMAPAWLQEPRNSGRFARLIDLIAQAKLSSRAGKDVLALMASNPQDPESIAQERGLFQKSDSGALQILAKKIIDANAPAVAEYRAGKLAALQFLVGQGMKESRGSANPNMLKEAFEKILSS